MIYEIICFYNADNNYLLTRRHPDNAKHSSGPRTKIKLRSLNWILTIAYGNIRMTKKETMNLRDLEYFVKVAELQHFGKAAAACFVSQPTLSMQLRKLEEELNVMLFHRENKKIQITEAGTLLLPKALEMITAAKEIKSMAKTLQDPFALPIHLGVIPTISPYLMPHILLPLKNKLPKLKLILIEEKTQTLLTQLQNNDIDLALLALPIPHHFAEHIFYEEPFMVAFPKGHAFTLKKAIKPEELAKENLLMLEEGHCLRDQALSFCKHFDPSQETYRAASLETLCQMVALGHGITILPKLAAKNRTDLETRPFTPPIPNRKIGLIWKPNSPRIPLIKAFIEEIDKLLKTA